MFATSNGSGSANGTSNQQDLSSDSPDSGKGQEISSESISDAFLSSINDQRITNSWNLSNNNKCVSILDDITTQSISINDTVIHKTKLKILCL